MSRTAPQPSDRWRVGRALAWAVGAAVCIYSFWDARQLNSGYSLPTDGTSQVPEPEQVFYVWFAMCGSLAIVCLARCLTELGIAPRLSKVLDTARARPGAFIACIALFTFTASLLFRRLILLDQPVADDEATYRFIARTLLTGHVTNPIPDDPEFFKNQFVVMNEHGWHGKYPIGHPLVLAIGEALGLIDAIPPLISGLCVWLTYRVGSKLFDARVAIAGATLLFVSPHFVWTCGTLLSQPTLALVLLGGMLLVLNDADQPSTRNLLLAGFVFGFGVLVRPLPGALFALVAAAQLVLNARARGESWGRCALRLVLFGAAAVPWLAAFAAANYVQSGNALTSGYQEVHKNLRILQNRRGEIVNSVFGGLLRENFWVLAWPFGLVLLAWCRPLRARALFWGLLGSQIVYRIVAPKTVVSVTGPIYLTETVPLLTLAAADALARLGQQFANARVRPSVVAVAATLVGAATFAPIQLGAVAVGAATRNVAYNLLEETKADRALVFANAMLWPESAVSWAYFPDNPSPRFDDRWLFVRIPDLPDPRPQMIAFWRKHFPDRRAFVFAVSKTGPMFQELELNPR
jgi:Dolichyl-phosphate-mannose-protein mannosyltransferase